MKLGQYLLETLNGVNKTKKYQFPKGLSVNFDRFLLVKCYRHSTEYYILSWNNHISFNRTHI